ncbi:hypothetical protein [Ferruginibacter sp.]
MAVPKKLKLQGCDTLAVIFKKYFMALEEFEREQMSDREKHLVRMKSITNYTMGVFFIGVGFFFMFPIQSTQNFISKYDPTAIKLFAVICWIYGLFRLYRGYKKNYFRN